MDRRSIPPEKRDGALRYFMARVNFPAHHERCWEWAGNIDKGTRYGTAKVGNCTVRAHQLAWMLEYGAIPQGLDVCHSCDNRPCVNPDHLFLGTRLFNLLDMWAKGRGPRSCGERHGKARLTEADVVAIRAACAQGVPQKELAARYGVTPMTISNIHCRATWKHLKE